MSRFILDNTYTSSSQGGNHAILSAGSTKDEKSGSLFVDHLFTVLGTEDATDDLLGSIATKGGISAEKSIYTKGNARIKQTCTVDGKGTFNDNVDIAKLLSVDSATVQTSLIALGSFQAGTSALLDLKVQNLAQFNTATFSGITNIINTLNATSISTGALVTAGGIGCAQDFFLGGNFNVSGDILGSLTTLRVKSALFSDTTESTSSITGSVTTSGGLGVLLSAFIGKNLIVGTDTSVPRLSVTADGITLAPDGMKQLYLFASNFATYLVPLVIKDATDATDINSGALRVTGGTSINKALWVGGLSTFTKNVLINSTTNATDLTQASILTQGGLVVQLDGCIGGNITCGLTSSANPTSLMDIAALKSNGGMIVQKDSFLGGKLSVAAALLIQSGGADIRGGINVRDGNVTVGNGNASVSGTMSIFSLNKGTSSTSFDAALNVSGGATINDMLYANGASQFGKTATYIFNNDRPALIFNTPSAAAFKLGVSSVNNLEWVAPVGINSIYRFVSDTGFTYNNTLKDIFTLTPDGVRISSNAEAIDTQTGCLRMDGGFSALGSGIINKTLRVNALDDVTSLTGGNGAFLCAGGAVIAKSLYVGGILRLFDTTNAVDLTSGSFSTPGGASFAKDVLVGGAGIIKGALSVAQGLMVSASITSAGTIFANSAVDSLDINHGSIVCAGAVGIQKRLNVGGAASIGGAFNVLGVSDFKGALLIEDVTDTTSLDTGCIVANGGMAIKKNVFVGGSQTIGQDLIVKGRTFLMGDVVSTQSQVNVTADNIVLINANAQTPADTGIALQRGQTANDAGTGAVIADRAQLSGVTQVTGNTTTTVTLDNAASSTDNIYNECWITVGNMTRKVKSYSGTGRVVTIYGTADQVPSDATTSVYSLDFTTVPNNAAYSIFVTGYAMNIFSENYGAQGSGFVLGYSPNNPLKDASAHISRLASVYAATLSASMGLIGNTLDPYDANGPVTINKKLQVDNTGGLNNVKSINNVPAPVVMQISLLDNGTTSVSLTGATKTFGSYRYSIEGINSSLSCAIGEISCNSQGSTYGKVASVKGSAGELVGIQWMNGSPPTIYLQTPVTSPTGALLTYNVSLSI